MKILTSLITLGLAGATTSATSNHHSHQHLRERRLRVKQDEPPQLQNNPNPDVQKVINFIKDTSWQRELRLAIKDDDKATCKSPLTEWYSDQVDRMGWDVYTWLDEKNVFDMPFVFKVLLDRYDHDEYIGIHGEETYEIFKQHKKANAFWESVDAGGDLDTHNIKLLGCHGKILKDPLVLSGLLLLFGEKPFHIPYWVSEIQNYIENNVPDKYNNPLFTANGLAVPNLEFFGFDIVPPAIIIGDGIIEFANDLGYGRDGPDFVHAHEYGHQMQLDVDVFDDDEHLPVPEQTRRTELMADALSAYFLSHDDGGNLSKDFVQELHDAAFIFGDCLTKDDSHHGTPMQRACATSWGASQAKIDSSTDVIVHPSKFRSQFDTVLDDIVDVDQSVCPAVSS